MWPCCIVTNFFVIKPTRCTNFTNLFCHETLHVSDSSSVHHQEFIHCTLSNGMSHRFVDSFWAGHIPLLSVQWINSWRWTNKLSKTCRVSWQNKFVKLMHLVGFIIKKNNGHYLFFQTTENTKIYTAVFQVIYLTRTLSILYIIAPTGCFKRRGQYFERSQYQLLWGKCSYEHVSNSEWLLKQSCKNL